MGTVVASPMVGGVQAAGGACTELKVGSMICEGGVVIETGGSNNSGGHSHGPLPDPADVLHWPDLRVEPGVGWCIYWHRIDVYPGAATSARAAEAERRWLMLLGSYPMCPRTARPPTVRATPQVVAREVVEEIDLPVPAPSIAPGFALTGKPAYLETGTTLDPPTVERPTELGTITVTPRGVYVVDWGDGTPPERHAVEGGPWPDGRISHVYTRTGRYDVVVAVEWTAQWVVAGVPGTLDGLRTEATVAGFEARQLQAVRDR